jgi:hypothetical protein
VSVGIAAVLDMSAAPQMDVLLVSDSQHSGRGFRALYQHIPCNRREGTPPGDCGQVTDGEHFTLTSSVSKVHRSCVYRILKRSTVSASCLETVGDSANYTYHALNESEFCPRVLFVCVL